MTRIRLLLAIAALAALGQPAAAAKMIKPPEIVNGAGDPPRSVAAGAPSSTASRAETPSERRERLRMEHDMIICKGC